MNNNKSNRVMTEQEMYLHEHIESFQQAPNGGLLTLYFPNLPQRVAEGIADMIQELIEEEFQTQVIVEY